MKLEDILNTEDCATHEIEVHVKGGKIGLTITDKYTKAWNKASVKLNRDFLANYSAENKDELNEQSESELYAALVIGWSLEDDLNKSNVIELFIAYPIIKHEINLFLLAKENELNEQKKS